MTTTTTIESVTVYKRGARIRRAVPIDPGATEVKLPNLPLALDDGSVRVQIEGQGVRAVDVRMAVEIAPQDPSLLPPRDEELRASSKTLALVRADVERITLALARLDLLEVTERPRGRRGEKPAPIPSKARMELAKLRTSEAARLYAELAQRKAELRRAERTHADLDDRARRASNARNTREHELRKSAIVRLDGKADPGAKLALEYFVPGACWSPAYTVWLEDGDRARVAMRAVVAQRTGEDWKGVKLVLSTAVPDVWTELPELQKLRIGRAQPPKSKRGWREPPEGAIGLYADFDRTFGEPHEQEVTRATTTIEPAPEPDYDLSAAVMDKLEALGEEEEEEEEAEEFEEKKMDDGRMRRLAPPPPPPQAMPMAAPEMMQEMAAPMRAKSGGSILGAVAGIALAPAALVAGAFEAAKGAPAAPGYGGGIPMSRAEPMMNGPATTLPQLELDIQAMAYGRLRMFGADSVRRGELAVVAAAEVYAEGLGVSLDIGIALRMALRATHVDTNLLPPGYAIPETPDAFDYAYAADVPADVPADGAFHVVPVVTHECGAKMKHVAVPREASEVFRLVRIEGPDAALLDGPADIYEKKGGEYTYLLTGRMPPTPPKAEVALGLGVEQSIKVARNTTFTEQSTGLLGGGLALVHDLVIDVKNNLARKAEIEVRERIPVKREDDDDVEIEIGTVEPAWEEFDQDDSITGGRVWTIKLAAGAEKTLKARYTVRIASKHQLVGGNRRES